MKKIAFIFVLVFLSVNLSAQKVIQMENTNGVYRIACSVNGAKMKMIFDTGASAVSLSESMANFLYDNDFITDEDILGTSKTQTADGSIHNNVVINIKDIEISGLHLKNVQAVVLSSQNAPLLLGQTAIQKLGKISLNGNKLIIYDYDGDYSEEELDKLINDAAKYYDKGSFNAAIENFIKYLDYGDLSTYGYYLLTDCFFKTKQFDKCIKYGKEWEIKYRNEEPSRETASILGTIAASLNIENRHKEALSYREKCLSVELKFYDNPFFTYFNIALSYSDLKDNDNAINYFKKALNGMFKEYNTSEKEIESKGIDNENIGTCLFWYALTLYDKNEKTSGDYIMGLSAKCNYDDAKKYLYKHDIKYNSHSSLFE